MGVKKGHSFIREMIDAGDLDETFAAATEIGEVQHVYRSEVGSGEEASRLVLQTEVGKGREVYSLLQSKFHLQIWLNKVSAILELL